MGQLVTGVNLNVPDVGGARAMQQTYMSTRGLTSANNIVQVDGLMINGLDGDGAVVTEIASEEHHRHAAFTKRALDDVAAGKTRFEALLQVVHESTILPRCVRDS